MNEIKEIMDWIKMERGKATTIRNANEGQSNTTEIRFFAYNFGKIDILNKLEALIRSNIDYF